jgi:hypothetical protein
VAEITRRLTNEVREVLEYDPSTGEFFWKISGHGITPGQLAGSVYPNGYRYIQFGYEDYRAGRLAWFFVTSEDPVDFIDHKDGVRDNNRFNNLRKATNSQNQANATWSTNTSGLKGVSWEKDRGKWRASITINGKAKNLGRYDSIVEAGRAYRVAAIEAWGEFALVPEDDELIALAEELERKRLEAPA